MKTPNPPTRRTRTSSVLSKDRALPEGFTRLREDTTVVVASEAKVADDGLILDGPWDLQRYASNPVVLWSHNRWEPDTLPIGKSLQVVETVPGTIVAEIEWDLGDPRGAEVARKYRDGYLSAVSIRWTSETVLHASKLPEGDPRRQDDVWIAQGNRLIEISAVVIGALDSALAQRSADTVFADLSQLLRERPELQKRAEAIVLAAPSTPNEPAPEDVWHGWFNQEK